MFCRIAMMFLFLFLIVLLQELVSKALIDYELLSEFFYSVSDVDFRRK